MHGALRTRSVRVLRPFLSLVFAMLSLLCGLVELALNHNTWYDLVVGWLLGGAMALYLVSNLYVTFISTNAFHVILHLCCNFLNFNLNQDIYIIQAFTSLYDQTQLFYVIWLKKNRRESMVRVCVYVVLKRRLALLPRGMVSC